MPNWCSCNLRIMSNPVEIDKVAEALKKATSTNYLGDEPNTFKQEWLGNLLCYTGMSREEVSEGGINCRGSIEDWERLSDTEISIDIDTAWCPQFGAFPIFFDYLGVKPHVTYSATEYGEAIFVTNDPEIEGTFMLEDYSGEHENYQYDLSEQSLKEILRDDYGLEALEGESTEDLIERALDEHEDLSIYMYEYEDFDTWVN